MEIINIASGSSANCYYVSDGKTSILLEAGVNIKKVVRAIGANRLKAVRACLVTHCHLDHSEYCNEFERHGMTIFTGAETILKHELSGIGVENKKQFEIGSLNIVPFNVEHDSPDSFGYVIASRETGEQLLFATDTYFVRYRFANLTHILIECNFDRETLDPDVNDKHLERVFESHFSLQDLVIMLKSNDLSKLQKVYLCHLSESNLDFEKARKTIQETTGVPVYLCSKNGGFE